MAFKNPTMALAAANLRNLAAEKLYLKTGIDTTRPIQIYSLINTRCNARCRMCNCWRKEDPPELPASAWIGFLKGLKEFSGTYNVSFSGGEPLVKKDLFEILDFCSRERIIAGITTNGILLKGDNVKKLIDSNLYNLNVSLDSMDDAIHDDLRGVPGLLARLRANMDEFVAYRDQTGSKIHIILKPMVCSETLPGLHKIVEYAKEMGIDGVNFQPVFEWSEESKEMAKVDRTVLNETIDRLAEMKKNGYPVLNSEASMRQWNEYFDGTLAGHTGQCVVALRNLSVSQDGTIHLCGFLDTNIGNITDGHIRDLWNSPKARKFRSSLVDCKKACLSTCVVKRGLKDYVSLFRRLMR